MRPRPRRDHPRSRGEYEFELQTLVVVEGSSPLSRGIRSSGRATACSRGIIPALAGNTSCWSSCCCPSSDHPRSRGEYEVWVMDPSAEGGSSPLSRGIRQSHQHRRLQGRIIPALAGNTNSAAAATSRARDHPRSRGEYERDGVRIEDTTGSSPLSRGILLFGVVVTGMGRIIPALAGNTCHQRENPYQCTDHPRSRGEYVPGALPSILAAGSSPLSRGIHSGTCTEDRTGGIIPALAGNTGYSHH